MGGWVAPFEAFLDLAAVEPDATGVVASIPSHGGVVISCNHPFGGMDALIASVLALRAREDALIVANAEVGGIAPIAQLLIPLEIMGKPGDERRNVAGMRKALDHLRSGGALVVFPAGAVARWQPGLGRVEELPWSTHISRLIRKAQVPVLPVRFFGDNPAWFHLLGAIHPLVRSALIPRVFLSQKGMRVRCRAGKLLTPGEFPADSVALNGLLRARLEEVSETPGN